MSFRQNIWGTKAIEDQGEKQKGPLGCYKNIKEAYIKLKAAEEKKNLIK